MEVELRLDAVSCSLYDISLSLLCHVGVDVGNRWQQLSRWWEGHVGSHGLVSVVTDKDITLA